MMRTILGSENIEGIYVSTEDMLAARDRRAEAQRLMLAKSGVCVVSFTLNIPGPVKRSGLSDECFEDAKKEILRQFERRGWVVIDVTYIYEGTGAEALWAVDADLLEIKRAMVAIEESHPIGRLLDIDVIAPTGVKASRTDLALPERGCFICGEPGAGCARSRRHTAGELAHHTNSVMREHLRSKYADAVARLAVRALLYEVCVTPKPGLVDMRNSGAHRDMDIFTFMDSAAALGAYFRDMALLGAQNCDKPPEELLARLRYRGMIADDEMLAATGGVNTHKGIIFSAGILCAAFGYAKENGICGSDALFCICGRIAAPAVQSDFCDTKESAAATKGENLYARYRIMGVRGEAAAGFPSVRRWGLPTLEDCIRQGWTLNDAGVAALLMLMANVEDTNLISRSSVEEHRSVREKMARKLRGKPGRWELIEWAGKLDERFIKGNLSPGGCADLLAISLMLHFAGEEGLL